MNLIDVIKCEVNDKELVYKFPSENLRLGSQLVVYPNTDSLFCERRCDFGRIYLWYIHFKNREHSVIG